MFFIVHAIIPNDHHFVFIINHQFLSCCGVLVFLFLFFVQCLYVILFLLFLIVLVILPNNDCFYILLFLLVSSAFIINHQFLIVECSLCCSFSLFNTCMLSFSFCFSLPLSSSLMMTASMSSCCCCLHSSSTTNSCVVVDSSSSSNNGDNEQNPNQSQNQNHLTS